MIRRRFLRYTLAAAATAAGGVATVFPRRANAYYSGPVSDHFDGHRFFNPGGRNPQGVERLAKLYLNETWSPWPEIAESPYSDVPPPLVPGEAVRIAFVGHASWLVQTGGRNILIDPVWSERAGPYRFTGPKRVNPPGIDFTRLPQIHAVLVTHNHYDHLDTATLGRLWQRDRPLIVTPLGNDTIMRADVPGLAATAVDWHATVEIAAGLRVHVEPTQHWSARGIRDRRHALWASFVIETARRHIYAVGDSGFGDGRTFRAVAARHSRIDLALLPIGAYEPRWFMRDQHMNPADAVEAFTLCGARSALGHHWGTFRLTTEAHDQPQRDLATALAARGVMPESFRAVLPGQVVTL